MKVILHVDEKEKWKVALGNIENLLKLDNTLQIEMLVHNEPVIIFKKDVIETLGIYDKIYDLSQKGVKFAVCNNTLNKMNINKNEICDFVKIVPAGVMELIEKQNEGYFYIKP